MMSQYNIDINGFVETNIRWNPLQTNQAKALLRSQHRNAMLITTNSDDVSPNVYWEKRHHYS